MFAGDCDGEVLMFFFGKMSWLCQINASIRMRSIK